MKDIFKSFQFLLLMCGVFGAGEDEVKAVSVMEGDSVTLNPHHTQIQRITQILWRFGSQGSTIAEIAGNKSSYEDEEIFNDRLQLDLTGSLTIENMKIKHSGRYKAEISHSTGEDKTIFIVNVYESPSVTDAVKGEMIHMSVTEGDSVTLQTDVTELHGKELIVWRFGDEGKLIAKHDIEAKSSPLYDTKEGFRDRLKLENKTGSLVITNTRTTDSGSYKVKISSNKQTIYKRFTVAVSVPGLSPGTVAGIAVAVLLVAVAALGVIYYLKKKMEVTEVSAFEGDDFELTFDNEIQTDDSIEYRYGEEGHLIAEKNKGGSFTFDDVPDERFRDRLLLNKQTGSLTIKNSRTTDAGIYELKISSKVQNKCKTKRFKVSVSVENLSVMEGDDVTLRSNTKIHYNDQILWMFGDENTPIAEITKGNRKINDETFTLDEKNVLTIINTRPKNSGGYKLKIISSRGILCMKFIVTVKVRIVPVMKTHNVTISTFTEIQSDDKIEWRYLYGVEDVLIAQNTSTEKTFGGPSGIFTNKLNLHDDTGSLTISNIEKKQSGVYELKISSSKRTTYKRFTVIVYDEMKVALPRGNVILFHEILQNDQVTLQFGDNSSIAKIRGTSLRLAECDGVDEKFRGRLKVDETGSLTISDIRIEHTGHYKLQAIGIKEIYRFQVAMWGVPVSLEKGESVTLHSNLLIRSGDQFLWMFGDQDLHIAEIRKGTGRISEDKRFTDTLKPDENTGSLTITKATTEHTGQYKLQISSSRGTYYKIFSITVCERRVNESAVAMPLLNEEDRDGVNDQEGTSSL